MHVMNSIVFNSVASLTKENSSLKGSSICLFFMLIGSVIGMAQTNSYSQFSSEISLSRVLNKKMAAEFVFSDIQSSAPNESAMFKYRSSYSLEGWLHYFASSRYKLSVQLAYFNNKNVPDLNQENSTEYRISPQLVYFFHKTGYTLFGRARVDNRFIDNDEGKIEWFTRLRAMVKLTYPFNSKVIRKGVIYGFASEEIFIKSASDVSGASIFDRNSFTIGTGFAITDNIQAELSYQNEWLPRPHKTDIYNSLKVSLQFTNFLSVVKTFLQDRENRQ